MSDQQGYRPSGYSDPGPDYGTPYHQQSAPNLGYQGQPGYGQQPGYGAVGQQQLYQQQGYGQQRPAGRALQGAPPDATGLPEASLEAQIRTHNRQ